jgi:hypothetical protein
MLKALRLDKPEQVKRGPIKFRQVKSGVKSMT